MMNLICRFCGSRNVKAIGGDNGDPFGRRPEKVICSDCGRTVVDESFISILENDESTLSGNDFVLHIEFHAEACGINHKYVIEMLRADGVYDLSDNSHPALSHFHTLEIRGQSIFLNQEEFLFTRSPMEITKHYTAYTPDRVGWPETVVITFTEERK